MWVLWFWLLLLPATVPNASAAKPTDCGDTPATAPAFEIVDRNPSSATYEKIIKNADFAGRTWVIYWAQSS